MGKKKLQINQVVNDMIDGLECPTPEIINGKKHIILRGDFVTFEVEPGHGDRAFGVAGEQGDPCYYVEVTQVDD